MPLFKKNNCAADPEREARPMFLTRVRMRMMATVSIAPLALLLAYFSLTPSFCSAFLSVPRGNIQGHIAHSFSTHSRLALAMSSYRPFTQVISDVDDTLKSSGGVNVAGVALGGIDVQYERGDFYPGVFQFMLEMSLHSITSRQPEKGGNGEKTQRKLYPPKVAVLTARAEEFKAALELKEDSKLAVAFRKTGERAGYDNWGLGPVLYGSVAEWLIQDRKGLRKFSNFERLLEQDPSGTIMQYVYVGDTGELDQEAGETMLREYPEVVKAVFLHVVSDSPFPEIPPPKLINGRPVLFFRTYVGAAVMATQLGLMEEDAMMRVVAAAEEGLSGLSRSDEKWVDLEKDIGEAYRTLSSEYIL